MASSVVFPIVPDGVTCKEAAHEFGESRGTTEEQKMDVIIHQNPGKNPRSRSIRKLTETGKKLLAIRILPKDRIASDPSDHHVVESSGSI